MDDLYLGPVTFGLFFLLITVTVVTYFVLGDKEEDRDLAMQRALVFTLCMGWFTIGLLVGTQTFTWDTLVACDPHWLFPKFCSND